MGKGRSYSSCRSHDISGGQGSGRSFTQWTTTANIASAVDNWGLGFGAEGEKPTGNVSVEELKQYDTYYVGDGDDKVIYLTFDCGYAERKHAKDP